MVPASFHSVPEARPAADVGIALIITRVVVVAWFHKISKPFEAPAI
jgi:hypothetical protein